MHPPHLAAASLAPLRHGFFGRDGGVSEGIYASLNAGPGSKDDPLAVAENRRRIAAALSVPPTRLVSMHQVHSATALLIDHPWPGRWPEADAIVTTAPGLALAVLTADCAPVLLADRAAGVIAAAHAGWKGALGGILEAVIAKMREAGATNIAAAIGPTIQQRSYEVGPDLAAPFLAQDPQNARFFRPGAGDRQHFDLPGYCAARLAGQGVNAEILAVNTYADPARFSHRRSVHAAEGDYGRNCAAIVL